MFAFAFFFSSRNQSFLSIRSKCLILWSRPQRKEETYFQPREKDPSARRWALCSVNTVQRKRSISFSLRCSRWRASAQKRRFLSVALPTLFPRAFGFVYWLYTQRRKRPTAGGCLGARGRQTTHTLSSLLSDQRQRQKIYLLLIKKKRRKKRCYCLQKWAKELQGQAPSNTISSSDKCRPKAADGLVNTFSNMNS